MKKYEIDESLMLALLNYLKKRPLEEVEAGYYALKNLKKIEPEVISEEKEKSE